MDTILFFFVLLSFAFSLVGWGIHLYTLILSYFSDNKWSIRIEFNCYHEAIPEIVLFTAIILFTIITIIMLGGI